MKGRAIVIAVACGLAVLAVTVLGIYLHSRATGAAKAPSPVRAKQNSSPRVKTDVTSQAAGEPRSPLDHEGQLHKSGFSRPEDRAGDFSGLDTATVLDKLEKSEDIGACRKAAQEIGDRSIAGNLELSAAERDRLGAYVDKQMQNVAGADSQTRVEANMQIQRLWRLSADSLFENLGSPNEAIAESAIKNLVLMRDEEIVRRLIDKAKSDTNAKARYRAVFALGMVAEKSYTAIEGRPIVDDKTAAQLVDNQVIPFLKEIQKTNSDPKMQQVITNAFRFLTHPIDHRPRKVEKSPSTPVSQ